MLHTIYEFVLHAAKVYVVSVARVAVRSGLGRSNNGEIWQVFDLVRNPRVTHH